MKRIRYWAAAVYLSIGLLTGCGAEENRYTYRDAGIEALNAGNLEEAIVSFDQAIEASKGLVGPFDVDVLRYRAEAEYLLGDYGEAAETYGILIQVDGEQPEYYNLRCVSRAQTGDYTGALDDFQKAVELDTQKTSFGRVPALLAAGAAMESQGLTADAMALYDKALAEGIISAELYNRMGLCRMTEENYEEALTYFADGLSAPGNGNVPELWYNQAAAYEHLGQFDQALESMNRYVSMVGTDEAALREIEFLKTR